MFRRVIVALLAILLILCIIAAVSHRSLSPLFPEITVKFSSPIWMLQ
jgi:hypothetical protein